MPELPRSMLGKLYRSWPGAWYYVTCHVSRVTPHLWAAARGPSTARTAPSSASGTGRSYPGRSWHQHGCSVSSWSWQLWVTPYFGITPQSRLCDEHFDNFQREWFTQRVVVEVQFHRVDNSLERSGVLYPRLMSCTLPKWCLWWWFVSQCRAPQWTSAWRSRGTQCRWRWRALSRAAAPSPPAAAWAGRGRGPGPGRPAGRSGRRGRGWAPRHQPPAPPPPTPPPGLSQPGTSKWREIEDSQRNNCPLNHNPHTSQVIPVKQLGPRWSIKVTSTVINFSRSTQIPSLLSRKLMRTRHRGLGWGRGWWGWRRATWGHGLQLHGAWLCRQQRCRDHDRIYSYWHWDPALCVTAQVSALLALTQRRRGAGAELGPGLPPLIVFRTTNILTLFTVKLWFLWLWRLFRHDWR